MLTLPVTQLRHRRRGQRLCLVKETLRCETDLGIFLNPWPAEVVMQVV